MFPGKQGFFGHSTGFKGGFIDKRGIMKLNDSFF